MKALKKIVENKLLFILFVIGFLLRLFYAHIDPYLHEWDERYHALVAKHFLENPFLPILRKSLVIPFDFKDWTSNNIWLHKQPLFMWQMALSMKLFGVNEFAIRYPSVIMGSIMIVLNYRITFLLTSNKQTSIIAALLLCFSYYQLELTSGFLGMEHNDLAFAFYILCCFWAYAENQNSEKKYWNYLIGLFAGLAILNKWMVGLLIFLPWFIQLLHNFFTSKNWKLFIPYFKALLVCLLIFLPWQIYILVRFHKIAIYEYSYNNIHLFEAVEGHDGGFDYYLHYFPLYFGEFLCYLLPIGIIVLVLKKGINKILSNALLISFFVVFAFFSFMVATKLPSYFFIVVPFGFIFIAIILSEIAYLVKYKIINYSLLVAILFFTLNPLKSVNDRKNNMDRDRLIYNTSVYKNLHLNNENIYVTNVNRHEDIDIMFYNNCNAYQYSIDTNVLSSLQKKHIKLLVFKNRENYVLPKPYSQYPFLEIIPATLQ